MIKVLQEAKTLSYRPCVVLMGRTGVGKTTLANALCGTDHGAGAGSGSITKNLYQNDVSCGTHSFAVIDTPGTDSPSEPYRHAYLLKSALTSTKLNTIFIVIKYENRFDKMLENYYEVQQMVDKYEKRIVVMVSHWDLSTDPTSHIQLICPEFEEYCANMIFFSQKSSYAEVANLMYSCISNMHREDLSFSDADFILNFNVTEIKLRIKKSLDAYRKKADSVFTNYQSSLRDVDQAPAGDRDELLHLFIVEFKDETEQLLQEFREQHRMDMQDIDYYTFYVKMEKENVKRCDSFVSIVTEMMSYNHFDNGDPRNLIKQCPHCNLIWFKTEGCDGMTTCGNNSFSSYFDFSSKPVWKYQLKQRD